MSFSKRTLFSEHVYEEVNPATGERRQVSPVDEEVYPSPTYRSLPKWFDDLPDPTLQKILDETYKSLQSESNYLATFGSRTIIDRLIVLTVGDQGNFPKGLQKLGDDGLISPHERQILKPVIDAGNAAAHRGWSPTSEEVSTILDTVEGLLHRVLVLPKMAEELEESVPSRGGTAKAAPSSTSNLPTMQEKVDAAPEDLKAIFDKIEEELNALGSDIGRKVQKHYVAFRRRRNFASLQIFNQKRILRVYLNIDPDTVELEEGFTRDVRQVGHFGTGDLEVEIESMEDVEKAKKLFVESYQLS